MEFLRSQVVLRGTGKPQTRPQEGGVGGDMDRYHVETFWGAL